jgi:hypothetical protein
LGMKRESINSGSIAEKVDPGIRGGSPAFLHLARTLTHPIPDPIILNEDDLHLCLPS